MIVTREDKQALVAVPLILAVGALMALAGGSAGREFGGIPVFVICAVLAFVINWVVFVPSYLLGTEHYFDLTGSLCYVSVVLIALLLSASTDARAILLTLLVVCWAVRLGSFLFWRVRQQGKDRRFDEIKRSLPRFLMTWTLQGLWVLLTAGAALAAISSTADAPLGGLALAGVILWAAGFALEVTADWQKSAFKADPANDGQFIHHGVWAWSRHPNYAGEIVLWSGIALIALPALAGWQLLTLISPLFVYVLLTRVSGVPMLERRADRKWGDDPAYQAYKASTPVLWPRPPSRRAAIVR